MLARINKILVLETGDNVVQIAWFDDTELLFMRVSEDETTKKLKIYNDNEIQIINEFSFENG